MTLEQINNTPISTLHDVVIEREEDFGKVKIEAIPPEEFLIERRAKSIQDANFVAHRTTVTRTKANNKVLNAHVICTRLLFGFRLCVVRLTTLFNCARRKTRALEAAHAIANSSEGTSLRARLAAGSSSDSVLL